MLYLYRLTEDRIERADREGETQEGDLAPFQKTADPKAGIMNVVAYGNMAIKVSKLASHARQKLTKATEEPSEQELLEEEMAVAAMGAKHTEQQLLRASRLGFESFVR